MLSEPESQECENHFAETANAEARDVFVEREFLLDRFSMRAQFDWRVARQSAEREPQAEETSFPIIFRSTSVPIFTRDRVVDFLSQVRERAFDHLRIRHASTPQVLIFQTGQHSWIEQDASIAPWRYMYFMGPRIEGTPMGVTIQTREALIERIPWLKRTKTSTVDIGSNDLLIYRSVAMQTILSQSASTDLKDQTVILSGWLW